MRLGDLVAEAWRNVYLGASHALTVLLVLAPIILGLAWMDMTQVAAVQREAIAYQAAGAATYVLSADADVDGARCESLGHVAGVRAAGALRSAKPAFIPRATPRNSIPEYDITPGLARQLDPEYTSGIGLDALTAQSLGIRPGELLHGLGRDAAIVRTYTYPDDGRDQTLAYALTRSGPASGRYDQCWLALWPPNQDIAGVLLRTTLVPGTDMSQVRSGQLNTRLGDSFDAPQRFASRTGRYAPLAAFIVGLGAVAVVARQRRLELAFARHLGVSRLDVVALLVYETTFAAVPALTLGALATGAYAHSTRLDQVWPFGLRVVAVAALGAVVGAVIAGLSARESRVFDYFKTR